MSLRTSIFIRKKKNSFDLVSHLPEKHPLLQVIRHTTHYREHESERTLLPRARAHSVGLITDTNTGTQARENTWTWETCLTHQFTYSRLQFHYPNLTQFFTPKTGGWRSVGAHAKEWIQCHCHRWDAKMCACQRRRRAGELTKTLINENNTKIVATTTIRRHPWMRVSITSVYSRKEELENYRCNVMEV